MITYFPSTPTIVDSNRILYTASSFARSSLLHLQEVGELTALQPHTSSRSDLSSYLFFEVVSGEGTLSYQGKRYELRERSCVFIDCNRPYSHTTDKSLWTIRWIHFNGPNLASIYQKYCDRGGRPVFSLDSLDTVSGIHTDLMSVAISGDYMRDMIINQLLASLLVEIMKESWHPEEKWHAAKRASVLEVKEWIDQNYSTQITLDSLAERFFINKYYLSKTFKSQFGATINSYLTTVRITHTKQMLRFTDLSLDAIGEAVGITPARYLSEVFTNVEGVSPSVYRKQW